MGVWGMEVWGMEVWRWRCGDGGVGIEVGVWGWRWGDGGGGCGEEAFLH
jgi:hypothetical protein